MPAQSDNGNNQAEIDWEMSGDRQRLAKLTVDELADALAGPDPGSRSHNYAMAELSRRQMIAELENTVAQKEAVIAQNRAAAASEKNASYMLWSVIVLAVSSFLNFVISLCQLVIGIH